MTRFAGYAAVFDRVDRAGDVIRAGAFAGVEAVPLLLQHRGCAVGSIEAIGEDATGLRVEGEVTDPEVARLVRAGALAGCRWGIGRWWSSRARGGCCGGWRWRR